MSFSFSFAGPREKVLDAIDNTIANMGKYGNNDTSQAQGARNFIAAEMQKYPDGKVLFVKAAGHHSISGSTDPAVKPIYTGNVNVSIAEYGDAVIVSMTDDLRAVAPNQISKLVEEIRSGEDSVSIRPIGNFFSFECPYCHREMILHHEGGGKSKHRRVIVYHRDTASADCFERAETEGERETRIGGWRDY